MYKHHLKIVENDYVGNEVQIYRPKLNEIIIKLPTNKFTIKLFTPLFDIESISPATISIKGVSKDRYEIEIKTKEYKLSTVVPSLILEIFNPKGDRIIKIVAPPDHD
ncbi:hypothetical protein [Chengkuizengella axinellae]|uniref:Uncharacterized protein n=1 Tax=Chengkuizengella axinellae TaxID=3064388 RepID=A0ABT9J4H0_9BACL|nr:hypothetical protein [Chengkuizengella sp. 2205SS18-9]MDP5276522.1 hypothetical protein [Chengkuizengella sp. 2205SS18-9]